MANRDFFTKPIQSDRNSHGYGNTVLEKEPVGLIGWLWRLVR